MKFGVIKISIDCITLALLNTYLDVGNVFSAFHTIETTCNLMKFGVNGNDYALIGVTFLQQ